MFYGSQFPNIISDMLISIETLWSGMKLIWKDITESNPQPTKEKITLYPEDFSRMQTFFGSPVYKLKIMTTSSSSSYSSQLTVALQTQLIRHVTQLPYLASVEHPY